MTAAVGETSIPIHELEIERKDEKESDALWHVFERAASFKESLGDVNLLGIVSVNWREVPCVLGLAIAVSNFVTSFIFTVSTPISVTLLLATASCTGIYYIRDSLNLRSLSFQINELRKINASLEEIRIKYENQGEAVETTLKELLEVEVRLLKIKAALDQTTKLLGDREVEYKALNDDHRKLYQQYESLLMQLKQNASS
jgi:hypothetical protein